MTTATITKFQPVRSPAKRNVPRAASRAYRMRLKRQGAAASAIGVIAATLTALSLSHLAHGIAMVSTADTWEAYALAIGVDAGFIVVELAMLFVQDGRLKSQIAPYAKVYIIGTLTGSACMNVLAFASGRSGWGMVPAIGLGVAIPAMIYCLTRIGAALYMNVSK